MKEAGIEIVEFDPIFQLGYLKQLIIVTTVKSSLSMEKLVLLEDLMSVMNILAVQKVSRLA